MRYLSNRQKTTMLVGLAGTLASGLLHFNEGPAVAAFIVSALTIGALASTVGDAVEELGSRLNPGATGVLQSGLGNLPELFVALFALRQGLVGFVQASLVGSILANQLLVLGLAFFFGGMRHGTQRFHAEAPRLMSTFMLLAVAALAVPTLAHTLHSPASAHEGALSLVVSAVLLLIFVASVPNSLRAQGLTGGHAPESDALDAEPWPAALAVATLILTSIAAAFVSDWFVSALKPAVSTLHISEGFTGLVIVAIAGNAVENVVGIQLAIKNKSDTAVSVVLNSPLQIALALIPALVLLSYACGLAHLTLVLAPLLLASLVIGSLITTVVVNDGESNWLEGMALVGVYAVIAASFWWG